MKYIFALSVVLPLCISACGNATTVADDVTSQKTEIIEIVSEAEEKIICRATVAVTMGRPFDTIGVDRFEEGITYVSYSRSSDGTVWKMRCKLQGEAVIWSTVDADGPGTGFGRWRNHSTDSKITYTIDEESVTIIEIYDDGSGSPKTFSRDDI